MACDSIIIDYETLGGSDHDRNLSSVIELGAVAFEHNPQTGRIPDYQEMVKGGFRVKFDLKSQKGKRVFSSETKEWWLSQSDEAKKILLPSSEDVTVEVGHRMFVDWMKSVGVNRNTKLWCRGNSFDIPILDNCLHQAGIIEKVTPGFWKVRDVRTRIEALLGDDVCECPLPLGSLPGFVHHNGIHDCAKDVMMMFYAYRYAFGMEDIPTEENCEPASLKKKR